MPTATPALTVDKMHKSFGQLEVLRGVSLTANDGDVISILGSSGSGKSTFLRCINLLETPEIPKDADFLAIVGPKTAYLEPELKKLRARDVAAIIAELWRKDQS